MPVDLTLLLLVVFATVLWIYGGLPIVLREKSTLTSRAKWLAVVLLHTAVYGVILYMIFALEVRWTTFVLVIYLQSSFLLEGYAKEKAS